MEAEAATDLDEEASSKDVDKLSRHHLQRVLLEHGVKRLSPLVDDMVSRWTVGLS